MSQVSWTDRVAGRSNDDRKLINIRLPKTFIAATKEYAGRLGMKYCDFVWLSLFRSLFEGLYESEANWTGDVLLSKENMKVVDSACNKLGIKRAVFVNYVLRKAFEGLDKEHKLDDLLDKILEDSKNNP